MVCARCAQAADHQLGTDHHCDAAPGPNAQCTCQHRTDRYRPDRDAELPRPQEEP